MNLGSKHRGTSFLKRRNVADTQTYHGLQKNNGDPRLFQSYLAVNKRSAITSASRKQSGRSKKLWRYKREVNRGKSRQIPFRKQWRSLFLKIATDRIAGGIPKNYGDHFGEEIIAHFGVHHFCECETFFFLNLR